MDFGSRIRNAWNAFMDKNVQRAMNYGPSSYYRAHSTVLTRGNERSIVSSIYNRIAMDVAAVDIEHVRLDENERFIETINSGLNTCLSLSANIDQTGRSLMQDLVLSMLDEGVAAIVPVDTIGDPVITGSYDIISLRVGKITEWFPTAVRVNLYNDRTGRREDIVLPKKMVGIIENPFYAVMNEPNSTVFRLNRKLSMLDAVDEQTSSGKLDLIVQLPYVIKSDARRAQANQRRQEIQDQLATSKYGIAYTDGTEKITQLNRSLENNLLKQIEYLTSMLYSQLGMPPSVFDGTADEATMLNYNNRTIEPIVTAIVSEMERKFLTKTARAQHQAIKSFMDPFRLVPVNQLAEIADKLSRNAILSSNEFRQIIGYKPVNDEMANELSNKNLNRDRNEDVPSTETTDDE